MRLPYLALITTKTNRNIFVMLLVWLFTIIFLFTFALDAAAQQPLKATVLLIDGSGSIDASDFRIQKEGIKLAIQNAEIVPRDGSIALTIIQYSGDIGTRIEVPYRVIQNSADVATVVTQIDGIVQGDGSTNPGDGISTAGSIFTSNSQTADVQIICLSTDGIQNTGIDVGTALNAIKNTSSGLDKFSVVAIADPGNASAQDLINSYEPHVFGDGNVTVVGNSTAFANSIGGCLTNSVELIGIEVNQALQDWNNSVILIEDKTTHVRAHMQPIGSNSTPVFAQLHGTKNGRPLSGSPLSPLNSGVVAKSNAIDDTRRRNYEESLNFKLPASWLNGTIDLKLEGIGNSIECKEAAGTPNDCAVQVTFNPTNRLEVEFVRVKWSDGTDTFEVPPGYLAELAYRLEAMFPIADRSQGLDWLVSEMTWPTGVITSGHHTDINLNLQQRRLLDSCTPDNGCNRLYYASIFTTGFTSGRADGIPGTVSNGFNRGDFNYLGVGRHVHAHEIGHTLERHHAVFEPILPPNNDISIPHKRGSCRAVGRGSAPNFPYRTDINGQAMTTIGPMDQGENSLIYGLDTYLLTNADLNIRSQATISPFQHAALMSYCNQANGRFSWISEFSYEDVRAYINNTFDSQNSNNRVSSSNTQQTEKEYIIISGKINLETNEVILRPLTTIFSMASPIEPQVGNYKAHLLDSDDNLIEELSFAPSFVMETDALQGTFFFTALMDPRITQVQIIFEDDILGSLSMSSNTPTVNVIFPNGGEGFSEGTMNIQWEGEDADNDTLTYIVQYSANGGTTWKTLAVNWPRESYEVSVSTLEETTQGLIRVSVSDGFRTASDVSDETFTLPNQSPSVNIISPNSSERFIGVRPITFRGSALDLEDGLLTGSNLVWMSNIDGRLGTGEELYLGAERLSEGEHEVSLTAIDESGLSRTASVSIEIFRVTPPTIYTSTLVSDWNLVSLPLDLNSPNPNQALADIFGNYDVILSFEDAGLTFDPKLPQFSTLNSIDSEHGYWIRMINEGILTLKGQPIPSTLPLHLESGWNLISYLPSQVLPLKDALGSIEGKYNTVLGYEEGATSFYTDIPPQINTLSVMKPGKGYWVYTTESASLLYPANSSIQSANNLSNQIQVSPDIVSTNQWINVYSQNSTYNNQSLPIGSTIIAIGEDGRKLGEVITTDIGWYGLLAVYGDDVYTSELDGATRSENINFLINGQPAIITNGVNPIWNSHGNLIQVDLAANGPELSTQNLSTYLPIISR